MKKLTIISLEDGDVTVDIHYSTINYKDGLVLAGKRRLVRDYPRIPGIDFAGVVSASSDTRYQIGDRVVLTGWRVGKAGMAGLAQKARVKAIGLCHVLMVCLCKMRWHLAPLA